MCEINKKTVAFLKNSKKQAQNNKLKNDEMNKDLGPNRTVMSS